IVEWRMNMKSRFSKEKMKKKPVGRNRRKRKPDNKAAHVSPPTPELPSYAVKNIKTEEINVPENRRKINPVTVEEIKESIRTSGLRTPLTVRLLTGGKKQLITGGHRLDAARGLGMKTVPCFVIKGKENARLWEIAENLYRNELTVLEESLQIVEWLT